MRIFAVQKQEQMNFESLVGRINQVQDVLQAQAAHAINLALMVIIFSTDRHKASTRRDLFLEDWAEYREE